MFPCVRVCLCVCVCVCVCVCFDQTAVMLLNTANSVNNFLLALYCFVSTALWLLAFLGGCGVWVGGGGSCMGHLSTLLTPEKDKYTHKRHNEDCLDWAYVDATVMKMIPL